MYFCDVVTRQIYLLFMLTGMPPLHIYKACLEKDPLLVHVMEVSEKTWKTHSNYLSIVWIKRGEGMIETDFLRTKYFPNSIYCFNNYQAFSLFPQHTTSVELLLFHPNFFCIETYQHEVGCNGVLFNEVYHATPVMVQPEDADDLTQLLNNIRQEKDWENAATRELVFSYLKIFLVRLTRLKTMQKVPAASPKSVSVNAERLVTLINENFITQHKPSFYANAMHLSVKALGNYCRLYFKKSISALINEKLLLKAKWELLHTNNQVKSIADALCFKDEYYFSRFFKKHIGISPKYFREAEWQMRKGYLAIPEEMDKTIV